MLLLLSSVFSFAGQALYVGPTSQFPDIQSAVNTASSGDVVLVDPTGGPYPPFLIDNKEIAVVSSAGSGARYTVQNSSFQAAVSIRNIPLGHTVTIYDLEIVLSDFPRPGLEILTCAGSVRIKNGRVYSASALSNGPNASVIIQQSTSTWLKDFDVDSGVGQTATGNGVTALRLQNSWTLVDSCNFFGMSTLSTLPGTRGGHGAELIQSWVHSLAFPDTSYFGGNGGTQGSDGLHLDAQSGAVNCLLVNMGGGHGSLTNGRAAFQSGNPGFMVPQACIPELAIPGLASADRVSVGAAGTATLSSLPSESYPSAFWVGIGWTQHSSNLPGLNSGVNPVMIDFVTGQMVTTLAYGPFSAAPYTMGTVNTGFAVPNLPALVGTQLTVQGGLFDPIGTGVAVTNPTPLVIVP